MTSNSSSANLNNREEIDEAIQRPGAGDVVRKGDRSFVSAHDGVPLITLAALCRV